MPTDPVTIALASLAVGLVIGTLIGRTLSGATKQRRTLTEELRKKDDELKTYQHKVTEHFITTSELVNNLTHSYKEVHQHLADSAMTLTNPEVSNKLLEAGSGNLGIAHTTNSSTIDSPQPPKDYTPILTAYSTKATAWRRIRPALQPNPQKKQPAAKKTQRPRSSNSDSGNAHKKAGLSTRLFYVQVKNYVAE